MRWPRVLLTIGCTIAVLVLLNPESPTALPSDRWSITAELTTHPIPNRPSPAEIHYLDLAASTGDRALRAVGQAVRSDCAAAPATAPCPRTTRNGSMPAGPIQYDVFLWSNPSSLTIGTPVNLTTGFVELTEANGTVIDHGVPPYLYTWQFWGGAQVRVVSNSTRVYLEHTFPCPDFQEVVAWVNDSAGDSAAAETFVQITPYYGAWTNASPPVIAIGSSVDLRVQTVGAREPLSVQWAGLPSDCPAANTTDLPCASRQLGIHYVTTTVTDARGCSLITYATFGVAAGIPPPQSVGPSFVPPTWILTAGVIAAGIVAFGLVPQRWVSRWRRRGP